MSGDHNMHSFSDELEHQQAQEEAHYWFALSDVVSYIDTIGVEKVLIDLSMMLQERQKIKQERERTEDYDELF
jgi:hypothetical protein